MDDFRAMWAETDAKDSEKLIHDVETAASTPAWVGPSLLLLYPRNAHPAGNEIAEIFAICWHPFTPKTYLK